MPFRYFHRVGGAPPETVSNFNDDAPEDVCGNSKWFGSSLQKWGLKQIFDIDIEWFVMISGNKNAPEEVCGNIIWFDSSLQKGGLKQIFDVDSRRGLTIFSLIWAAAFGCP